MQDKRFGRKQSVLWSLSKEELQQLVQENKSLSNILKKFNLTNNGACMKTLRKILEFHSIDFSQLKVSCRLAHKERLEKNYQAYILAWHSGKKKGWSGKGYSISPCIRRFLFEKNGHKCQECGWNQIHSITKKIPLQVDHIDGNASNCREINLRLLCPNCHSLTTNFGRLNKTTVRNHR